MLSPKRVKNQYPVILIHWMNFELIELLIDFPFAWTLATDWELQDFFSLVQEASVVDGDLLSWVCIIILVLVLMHLLAPHTFSPSVGTNHSPANQRILRACSVTILENSFLIYKTHLTNLTENSFFRICSKNRFVF